MEELIKSGKYDEARANILAGAAGDADALAGFLGIPGRRGGKEYEGVRQLLGGGGGFI